MGSGTARAAGASSGHEWAGGFDRIGLGCPDLSDVELHAVVGGGRLRLDLQYASDPLSVHNQLVQRFYGCHFLGVSLKSPLGARGARSHKSIKHSQAFCAPAERRPIERVRLPILKTSGYLIAMAP
jgi:hypothetical protein